MVNHEQGTFQGLACVRIWNDRLSLWLTTSLGPRILGLAVDRSDNLLAVLPEARIEREGGGVYSLRGGHRLWIGPEDPRITYTPDDAPVDLAILEQGLEAVQAVDPPTGIQKSLLIELGEGARVTIDHRLTNRGQAAFELAPWAITMLKPGGIGLIPFQVEADDPHGLLPNRQLVLWPYTRVDAPQLEITDQALVVRAELDAGALKVGAPNPRGWIAYRTGDYLFLKQAAYFAGERYLDRGASSQIYCSPTVIELETLGPVSRLEPGETVEHREVWTIYSRPEWPEELERLFRSIEPGI